MHSRHILRFDKPLVMFDIASSPGSTQLFIVTREKWEISNHVLDAEQRHRMNVGGENCKISILSSTKEHKQMYL